MRRILFAGAATLLAAGMLGSASAQTITYTVDCSKGQTISGAIARADARKVVVVVRGTCNEFVLINRDDVTLRGDPIVGGTVNGPGANLETIDILADRITIQSLTVTGGRAGIRIGASSYAEIFDSVIQGTAQEGIRVRSAAARIVNSIVLNAGGDGVYLMRGASALLSNSQIHDNAGSGIHAEQNSIVVANGSTVEANDGHGIYLESGSQGTMTGNTIAGNGQDAVQGHIGATYTLQGDMIRDNGWSGVVGLVHSTVLMRDVTIRNNAGDGVVLMYASKMLIESPSESTGNSGFALWCYDDESSVDDLSLLNADGNVSCTGYWETGNSEMASRASRRH